MPKDLFENHQYKPGTIFPSQPSLPFFLGLSHYLYFSLPGSSNFKNPPPSLVILIPRQQGKLSPKFSLSGPLEASSEALGICFLFRVGNWQNLSLPELEGPLTPSGLYRVREGRGRSTTAGVGVTLYPKFGKELGFGGFFQSTKAKASIFHANLATASFHQVSPAELTVTKWKSTHKLLQSTMVKRRNKRGKFLNCR